MKTLITLCTYNEVGNLKGLIPDLLALVPDATVLVIDDNSPDGTSQLVREMAGADNRIRLIHRPGKLGLGTATLAGFRFAMEQQFDLLLNMDADYSHGPQYVPQLIAKMPECDVAIASLELAFGTIFEDQLREDWFYGVAQCSSANRPRRRPPKVQCREDGRVVGDSQRSP